MEHEPFVPVTTVAKHFSVSVSAIRSWVRQGYIPSDAYVQLGQTYRFCLSRVVEALTKRPKSDVKMTDADDNEPDAPVELDLASADQDI